jgi:hypothetical protein
MIFLTGPRTEDEGPRVILFDFKFSYQCYLVHDYN